MNGKNFTPKTPSRQTSLEGFKEDDSSHKRAPRDGQWQSVFKIHVVVSSPCLIKDKMSDLCRNSTATVYNGQTGIQRLSPQDVHCNS